MPQPTTRQRFSSWVSRDCPRRHARRMPVDRTRKTTGRKTKTDRNRVRRLPAAIPHRQFGPVYGLTRTWFAAFPSASRSVACWRTHTRLPLRGQHRHRTCFPFTLYQLRAGRAPETAFFGQRSLTDSAPTKNAVNSSTSGSRRSDDDVVLGVYRTLVRPTPKVPNHIQKFLLAVDLTGFLKL